MTDSRPDIDEHFSRSEPFRRSFNCSNASRRFFAKLQAPREAILSSACAALASVFAKLAFDLSAESVLWLTARFAVALLSLDEKLNEYYPIKVVEYLLRILTFGATLALNCLMMKYFVDSLKKQNALNATVLNFALNFLFSAILGCVIFGEKLVPSWWTGAACLIVGVSLVASCKSSGNQSCQGSQKLSKGTH